jgi:hypothetical protein
MPMLALVSSMPMPSYAMLSYVLYLLLLYYSQFVGFYKNICTRNNGLLCLHYFCLTCFWIFD